MLGLSLIRALVSSTLTLWRSSSVALIAEGWMSTLRPVNQCPVSTTGQRVFQVASSNVADGADGAVSRLDRVAGQLGDGAQHDVLLQGGMSGDSPDDGWVQNGVVLI